jgi:hypothetical protein
MFQLIDNPPHRAYQQTDPDVRFPPHSELELALSP